MYRLTPFQYESLSLQIDFMLKITLPVPELHHKYILEPLV